jgi:hypothetical protein
MVQRNTNQRSTTRSTKPRIIYTAGNEADGNWVEESTLLSSIGQQ